MKRIAIAILIFSTHLAYGQVITLDEIMRVRTMDSLELTNYCKEKGFELKAMEVDTGGQFINIILRQIIHFRWKEIFRQGEGWLHGTQAM